jgi:hypothetical protein
MFAHPAKGAELEAEHKPLEPTHTFRPGARTAAWQSLGRMGEPTVYPSLNVVLEEFVASVRTILGDGLCAAYLQGSFAVGDADEHSDVDFIVVTHEEVSTEQEAALEAMHQGIYALATPWAQHLEGSYITKDRLRRVDPSRAALLYLDNGATEFTRDSHCNTAIVRWSLREHGVVLAGPDPTSLVDPVTPAELRADVLVAMDEWVEWLPTLDSWSARFQPYFVLTLCRILHTFETGRVASKREVGEWALGAVPEEWAGLIQRALEDRPDPWVKVHRPADRHAVERTRDFMDYVLSRIGE